MWNSKPRFLGGKVERRYKESGFRDQAVELFGEFQVKALHFVFISPPPQNSRILANVRKFVEMQIEVPSFSKNTGDWVLLFFLQPAIPHFWVSSTGQENPTENKAVSNGRGMPLKGGGESYWDRISLRGGKIQDRGDLGSSRFRVVNFFYF